MLLLSSSRVVFWSKPKGNHEIICLALLQHDNLMPQLMLAMRYASRVAKFQTERSQGYGDLWLSLLFLKCSVLEMRAS